MRFGHRSIALGLGLLAACGPLGALPVAAAAIPYGEARLVEGGFVRISAVGLPPFGSADGAGAKEVARQNALGLAQRRLLAAILDLPLGPNRPTVRDRLTAKPQARERLREMIAKAKVSGQELADGSAEVTLEVPYSGPGGLAEFLTLLAS